MRAQSACEQSPTANKIFLCIHGRNFGGHVTVHPTIRPAIHLHYRETNVKSQAS